MFEDPSGFTVVINATGVPKYSTGSSTRRVSSILRFSPSADRTSAVHLEPVACG